MGAGITRQKDMNRNQEGVTTHKVRGEEQSEFIFVKDVADGDDPRHPSSRALLPPPPSPRGKLPG